MKRDRLKRRGLYGGTAVAWVAAGHFVWLDLCEPMGEARTLMILTLTVAAVLSTASLFVWFLPTSDRIYLAGMEAGRRTAMQPVLTVIDGERAASTRRH